MIRRLVLPALAVTLAAAAPAAASGPALTVSKAKLRKSLKCPIDGAGSRKPALMFVTGTGATGDQGYVIGQDAFKAYGGPVCYVNFPDNTTADIQTSVEYLVHGLRAEHRRFDRPIVAYGISQGGLLPRFALTYWPDLRAKVSDVVAAAGTQHGTNVFRGCSKSKPCTPASWQQAKGSHLLNAINAQPDETPGETSYTTVRSATDETVQPQTGRHPTSALKGATNILIQDVCPGRTTKHIATATDSVTFAALENAIKRKGKGRRGAARVSQLPGDVCDHPYADDLDEAKTTTFLGLADGLTSGNSSTSPQVGAEPKVRKVFR